jgi:hypothetical protein
MVAVYFYIGEEINRDCENRSGSNIAQLTKDMFATAT